MSSRGDTGRTARRRRRGWPVAVMLVAALLTLVASASAAPRTPAVVAGWPVAAPSGGDAFAIPAGPVLTTNATAWSGGEAAGFARSGRRLWHAAVDPPCGNCYAPAVPLLSPTGVLGPIGEFGGGLTAFDRAGQSVPACAGVIAGDGDCYSTTAVPVDSGLAIPGWRLAVARAGHWRTVLEDTPPVSLPPAQPTFAFAGDVAVLHSPAVLQVLGIRRDTGAILWRLPAPAGTLGPVAAPDGTVRLAGPGREVVALDPRTAGTLWRAALPGVPLTVLADPAAAGSVVLGVRTGTRRALVRVDGAGRVHTGATRLHATAEVRAVGPDGVAYVTRNEPSVGGVGVLTAIDRRGAVRWRFAQPFGGAGTPAFVGRDVVVTNGRLMYRLRPARAEAPPRRTARLDVAPSRFRLAGPVQVCPTARRSSCHPATPRGTVVRLRLSRAAAGSDVRVSLVPRGGTAKRRAWSAAPFRGRPGSQWLALESTGRFTDPPITGLAPGRYSLVARGGTGARRWAVSAPVTVVRQGSPRGPGM